MANADHKEIGKVLDLFHLDGSNPGVIFWHPKGTILYWQVINDLKEKLKKLRYLEVKTPNILGLETFKKSGHFDNYLDRLFFTGNQQQIEEKKPKWIVTPMNCPGTMAIFKSNMRSYKDLPLKFSEMGAVYRYEQPGEINGLFRAREFTVDDAHIFCLPDQAVEEIGKLIDLILEFYKTYDFEDYHVELSTRPSKSIGTDEQWQTTEDDLKKALAEYKIDYKENPGEGAFYGPKIDFHIKDSLNRSWQLGTIQVDMSMAERLGCFYIDKDGKKQYPVVVHRAILGSIERFLGILIEHFGGAFPTWLSPVQVIVAPIGENHLEYSKELIEKLKEKNIRVELDSRNESTSKKVRDAEIQKVPYIVVIGDREVENKKLTVRDRESKQEELSLEDFIGNIQSL